MEHLVGKDREWGLSTCGVWGVLQVSALHPSALGFLDGEAEAQRRSSASSSSPWQSQDGSRGLPNSRTHTTPRLPP